MNTRETSIKQMQALDHLHTAVANAMPNASGPMRAELEGMELMVIEMRQRAGSAVDIT